MKAKKTPRPQRGGNTMNDRAARTAALADKLEIMAKRDPDGFAAMMKLLERLAVSGDREKK